jgi:hypothetical protein
VVPGPDSVPLGFADQVYLSDGLADGAPVPPPASTIYNPTAQPGIGPILTYLG